MNAPTLPEFILARVAEDEAMARAALSGRFTWASVDFNSAACAAHGDRHDPARILAQCAAYRGVIEAAWRAEETIEGEFGSGRSRELLEAAGVYPAAVEHLTTIWADHPDFDERWRP